MLMRRANKLFICISQLNTSALCASAPWSQLTGRTYCIPFPSIHLSTHCTSIHVSFLSIHSNSITCPLYSKIHCCASVWAAPISSDKDGGGGRFLEAHNLRHIFSLHYSMATIIHHTSGPFPSPLTGNAIPRYIKHTRQARTRTQISHPNQ